MLQVVYHAENPQDAQAQHCAPFWPIRALAGAFGLRRHEDLRCLGIVSATWLLFIVRWYLRDAPLPWIVCFMWWWAQAFFSFFCATIVHNSIHVPQFHSKWQNQGWQMVLSLSYGFPVSTLVPGHNLSHHKHTAGPKDVIRATKLRWSYNLLNLLLFVVTCVPAITRQDVTYLKINAAKQRPIWRQASREILTVVAVNLLFLFQDWRAYLMHVFFPQVFAKLAIISINLPQHDGCPSPNEDKYNFARNFTGPILNFFTCNNGYHTIHHLHPGMHWSMLEEAHMREVHPHIHPALEQPNMFWYLLVTYVLPGGRVMHDGSPYRMPAPMKDEPWYTTDLTETYSDSKDM